MPSPTRRPGAPKTEVTPWLREQWCIPPETDAAFGPAMEDALEVYHRSSDVTRPVVCLNEASKQLCRGNRGAGPGRAAE
jgi:hypothetical protein